MLMGTQSKHIKRHTTHFLPCWVFIQLQFLPLPFKLTGIVPKLYHKPAKIVELSRSQGLIPSTTNLVSPSC